MLCTDETNRYTRTDSEISTNTFARELTAAEIEAKRQDRIMARISKACGDLRVFEAGADIDSIACRHNRRARRAAR